MPRSRYSTDPYDLDYKAFGYQEPKPEEKDNYLADFLGLAGGLAPALGTAAGGVIGSLIAPGLGTAAGMGIGGALGAGAGTLANLGAAKLEEPEEKRQAEWEQREEERRARQQAAMSMMGGLR